MPINAKHSTFNITTQAAGNTVVVTGVGFQPKVVLFWWNERTASTDANGRASFQRGFGAAVGTTNRRSVSSISADAQAAADTGATMRNDACICTVTVTALDGLADLQSFDLDGFTLVIDDAFSIDHRIHYLALSDFVDITTGAFTLNTVTGNQDITSLSFQPDFLLLFYTRATSENGFVADSVFGMGAALSSTSRYTTTGGSNDAAATMQTASYSTDAEMVALLAGAVNTVIVRADFVQFLSNGFRINVLEASQAGIIYFVAFKGGNWKLFDGLTETNTTSDIVKSGFGFTPAAGMVISHCKAKSTQDTLQDDDEFSIGGFTGAAARSAIAVADDDGVADSVVSSASEFDEVYANLNATDGTLEGLMDVKSVDGDGVTFIMDDADPSQAFFWGWAVGDPLAGFPLQPKQPSVLARM